MEQTIEYRQQLMEEYKALIMPLLRYLPWFEQHVGKKTGSVYQGAGAEECSMQIPVYDSTLMNFVREASKSPLMDRNYKYVYTRNRIASHDDERKIIKNSGWKQWDILRGILSNYVMGGRIRGALWNEAVTEGIFYLTLSKMKEIVEFWDKQATDIEGN